MSTYNWRTEVLKRMANLINLAPGWDGYQGKPVQPAIAWFVLDMLEDTMEPDTPEPAIVPSSDGFIQVEWHAGDTNIELFVTARNKVSAWVWKDGGQLGESFFFTDDFTAVKDWLREAIETAKVET